MLYFILYIKRAFYWFAVFFTLNINNYCHFLLLFFEINFFIKFQFWILSFVCILSYNLRTTKFKYFLLYWFAFNMILKVLQSMTDWNSVNKHFTKLKLFYFFIFFLVDLLKTWRRWLKHILCMIWVEFFYRWISFTKT